MWFPIFEILAEAYHYTLRYILWDLTLPQMMRLLEIRSDRIEKQNEQIRSESGSNNDHSMRPMTDREAERRRKEFDRRKREYEESLKPENAPAMTALVNDFSKIFG